MTEFPWPAVRLNRYLVALRDGTHGTFARVDNGVALLSAKNVQPGGVVVGDESQIGSADAAAILAAGFPRRGDVLLTIVGTVGRSTVYDLDEPLPFQRSVAFLRTDSRLVPAYLNYQLGSTFVRDQMALVTKTSAQPGLYLGEVGALQILVPSTSEQKAIADYLDRETARIDTLIEEQQTLVGLLGERRVAAMAEPFGATHPTAPLGSVLEELIDHRGKTPSKVGSNTDDFTDEGVPVISAIHIKRGEISWGERERFVPHWMFERWMPVRLRADDVLLTSEAPLGNVAQVASDAPLVLSQRLFALRGRADVLHSTYLRYFLESDRGQALLRDGASGSTVSGIRQSRLVQISVPVPPLDEQLRYAQWIREQIIKIDALIAETERFIELSKERRSALITAAVTGQIDVREVA